MNSTIRSNVTTTEWNAFEMKLLIFLNTKFLLFQVLFGSGGNILNLIVLLSRAMRSRTNLIFAAMAFADLFFLILHTPTILFFTGTLMSSSWYRNGFSQVMAGMINWFSAVSIWCMMYATIERVQVFRSPFRTSKKYASTRFFGTLIAIVIICLLLTLVQFVSPKVRKTHTISKYLVISHMLFVVVIPMIVSTSLNILLISALRKNTMPIQLLNDSHIHQNLIVQRSKTERKVTFMVCVILSCFIICNAPGAIVFVLRERNPHQYLTSTHVLIQAICNSLAVTGKVLNFLLFCLSSEHFRALLKKRLCYLLRITPTTKRTTSYNSAATKTFSVPLNDI